VRLFRYTIVSSLLIALMAFIASSQSGKGTGSGRRGVTLNMIVHAPENKQVSKDDFQLYDQGIARLIKAAILRQ
jgi:hypothetical protein